MQKSLEFRKLIIYLFIFSSLSFFYLHKFLYFSVGYLETVSSYCAYPFLLSQNKVKNFIDRRRENLKTLEELRAELDTVKLERDNLLSENIKLKTTISYFDEIEELLDYKSRYEFDNAIIGKIILKQFSDNGHWFLLDKGSNFGIQKNMIAVYKNCIIGRVVEVYPNYSKILAITDVSSKIAAYCSETKAIGIFQGKSSLDEASLNFVNHLDSIKDNDLVISSGEGLIYPAGFALGKVSNYSCNGVQYFINVSTLIDLKNISYCYIIQKGSKYTNSHQFVAG